MTLAICFKDDSSNKIIETCYFGFLKNKFNKFWDGSLASNNHIYVCVQTAEKNHEPWVRNFQNDIITALIRCQLWDKI